MNLGALYFLTADFFHPALNYFTRLTLDPLAAFALEKGSALLRFHYLSVFGVGVFMLALQLFRERQERLVFVLGLTLSLFSLSNGDLLILSVAWFPALLASVVYCARGEGPFLKQLFRLLLLTGVGAVWVFTSGGLAILGLLAVYFAQLTMSEKSLSKGMFLSFLGLSVLSVLVTPLFQMPDYPPGALLAPLSPLLTNPVNVYASPVVEPTSIVFNVYRELLSLHAARLAIFTACLVLSIFVAEILLKRVRYRGLVKLSWRGILLLLLGFGVMYGELFLPIEYRNSSLYQSFRRVVPNFGLIELPWQLTPLLIVLTFVFLRPVMSNLRAPLVWLVPGIVLLLCSRYESKVFLDRPGSEELRASFQARLIDSAERLPVLFSPSRFVVEQKGAWILRTEPFRHLSLESFPRINYGIDTLVSASANRNPDHVNQALDGNLQTRWSTAGAQQAGDYYELKFETPVRISRILLRLGAFKSDFPGGVAVEVERVDSGELIRVTEEPEWLGSLEWSEDKYPYLGPQQRVLLELPQVEFVRRLRIVQLTNGRPYDWSIAEMQLYGPATIGAPAYSQIVEQ